jgi:hypothetical protein
VEKSRLRAFRILGLVRSESRKRSLLRVEPEKEAAAVCLSSLILKGVDMALYGFYCDLKG